ncbi:MAG: ricin-type beta-trefoil lectin domain protein [Acidimicrobiaceae bacterium]|nr:ricin-type beta-trefoil lectin domain protein [Acidimicrobiaceae bacterium]
MFPRLKFGRAWLAVFGVALLLSAPLGVAPAAAATHRPNIASVGPGERAAPASISASASTVCAEVAAKAGFSYTSTVSTVLGRERQMAVAVAIALAESSCNSTASAGNGPTSGCPNGSTDRGLWQINSCYHSEVSNACAYQIQCNADAAWRISNHGSNWTPWSTFNNGAWESYIGLANSAISGFSFLLADQAASGMCLDADASDVRAGGKIFQWPCNSGDKFQQWTVVVPSNGHNPILRNVGAHTCLDVDGSDVGTRGKIFQWPCSGSDGFQTWWFTGSGDLNTNGHADVLLHNSSGGDCLDVDSADVGKGGLIYQWGCNLSDRYQQWN